MSTTSSSSSSASTAPTRGAANYIEHWNYLLPLRESPNARLGRYDPMAHQALPDQVGCFADVAYRGTQHISTTVVQSGSQWVEVKATICVIISDAVRAHNRELTKP